MKFIEEVFNQMLSLKDYNVTPSFKEDFARLVTSELHDNYLVITPTERNIEITNSIMNIFPDIEVYNETKPNQPKISFSLMLLREIKRSNPHVNNIIGQLKNIAILIRKTPDLEKYLDSMKIMAKLEGKRYSPPRNLYSLPKRWYYRHMAEEFQKSKYVNEKISNIFWRSFNNQHTTNIRYRYDIDADEFLKMSHEERKEYRDMFMEEVFNDTREIFQTNEDIKREQYGFYINCEQYDKLSLKERGLLSKVNAGSSRIPSKVLNSENKFIVTVSYKSTYNQTRNLVMKMLENKKLSKAL